MGPRSRLRIATLGAWAIPIAGSMVEWLLRIGGLFMAIPHAKSGDLVNINDFTAAPGSNTSVTLVRDQHIEIFRLVLSAGTQMQEHSAAGAMTVQCLKGDLDFTCHGRTQTLLPGDLIYLNDGTPHALHSRHEAIVLITLILRRK